MAGVGNVGDGGRHENQRVKTALRSSLEPLTGLRFLAALWVLVYHYTIEFRFATGQEEAAYIASRRNPIDLVLIQGHLAVDYFFILSGFILAYTYVTADGGLRDGKRNFWVARVARIYPVYLLGLLLGLGPYILAGASKHLVVESGFTHLLMVQSWFPATLDWNQPSWSLSVEAFFYLTFPLLLPLFARLRRRSLLLLAVGSALFFGLVTLMLFMVGQHHDLSRQWWWRDVVRYNPLVSFPVFVVGMALGLLFVTHRSVAASPARWLTARVCDVLIVAIALAFLGMLVVLYEVGFDAFSLDTVAPFAVPFLAALIYLLAFQRGTIARLLSHPLVVWLGEISYGIYILHAPLWDILRRFVVYALHIAPGNVILIPVYALLVLAVTGISYTYIERPARRAIRSRFAHPRRVAVPSVVRS